MSDSESAAVLAEAPVPAACEAIKADLDKCVKENGARLTGNVHCTESSTFPAFPSAHGTGLNDTDSDGGFGGRVFVLSP
ncbi:hypothetical protein AALO_G00083340 [Alosa alosa]|uniref:Uncharacterized protein n=1 Tax=Alosa alosa TaxID=278164 RepID=A0AAV6H2H3_9TELE|nr:hypothetical protein AALO_G00083340 [Alosa alosa]